MNICFPTGIEGNRLQMLVQTCTDNSEDPIAAFSPKHIAHFTLVNDDSTGIARGVVTHDMDWVVDVPDTMFTFGRMSAGIQDDDDIPEEIPAGAQVFKIDKQMAARLQQLMKGQDEVEEEPRRNGGYL